MTKEELVAERKRQQEEQKNEVKMRQEIYDIEYAEDFEKAIRQFDEEWFLGSISGKFRVITKSDISIQMTDRDASDFFSNLVIEKKIASKDGDSKTTASTYQSWKTNADRYFGLAFNPAEKYGKIINEHGKEVWNTFRGWKIVPEKNGKARGFLSHVFVNICKRDKRLYNVIMDAWATHIQKPWIHFPKIFAMRGDEGAGKGQMMKYLMALINGYGATVSSSALESQFNGAFFQKLVIFADESCWAGSKHTQNKLKNYSGNDELEIQFKGKDSFITKNYIHLWVSTNEDWVAPTNDKSRRYVVWTVGNKHANDTAYFDRIIKDMENGGLQDLMYYLSNREIKTNLFERLPDFDEDTSAQQRLMTMENDDPVKLWLLSCQNGEVEPIHNPVQLKGKYTSRELFPWYVEWAEESKMYKVENAIAFGMALKKHVEGKIGGQNKTKWDFSTFKGVKV